MGTVNRLIGRASKLSQFDLYLVPRRIERVTTNVQQMKIDRSHAIIIITMASRFGEFDLIITTNFV